MKHINAMRWLGMAAALLAPTVALAALDIPNTFAAGDPVSASQMNANFEAVKAKVEELEARLNAHTTAETWIDATLLSPWDNYGFENGNSYATAAYRKDTHGVVHLKGLVRGGAAEPILTLPVGYRPAESRTFVAVNGTADEVGVIVRPTGNVYAPYAVTGGYISLEGISFHEGE